jgi:predicted transposase YbfD/YdcC
MHAQRGHATYLAGRGAHYLFTVKRNQPGLHAQLTALPWRQVPVAHDARERDHGRDERRTLKITAVAAGLAFPHAAQAIQIVRRRKLPGKKKWSRETVYAIPSLTATQASPAELAAIIRGHWMIEDRLHWVRDMDRSQIRTGSAPRVDR